MVFDWFRRQYNQAQGKTEPDPPKAAEATPPPKPDPTPNVDPSDPNPEATSESDAENYLAWAKAAFQNLKQQEAASLAAQIPGAAA